MEQYLLQRNPYHGQRVQEHKAFLNPSLDEIRVHFDAILRGEFWIPRSPDDEVAIQAYKRQLREEGKTIESEILALAGESGYVFMENRYPYALRDAEHFLLWITDETAYDAADQHIRQFISARNVSPDDIICYENNRAYQTVSGITHFHIYLPRIQ